MRELLSLGGTLSGVLGVLACLAAGAGRLSGNFYLAGLETNTFFTMGIGLMVLGCLLKLELISRQGS